MRKIFKKSVACILSLTLVVTGLVFAPSTAKADETGNFTELAEIVASASAGDTITLDKNYTYDSSTDSDLVDGIEIDKAITIDGGNFTINGSSDARAFYITSDNVTVTNTKFEYCSTPRKTVPINPETTWESEPYSNDIYRVGGAILIRTAHVTISNCTFDHCSAAKWGGAIYITRAKTIYDTEEKPDPLQYNLDFKISNCKFTYNNALYAGGAVAIEGQNSTIDGKSSFSNNYLRDDDIGQNLSGGGAVCILGDNHTITNSTFTNNTTINHLSNGGGVSAEGNNITVSNSTFNGNKAYCQGAGLYVNGNDAILEGNIFLNNSQEPQSGREQNHGSSSVPKAYVTPGGGAIAINGSDANLEGNKLFTNNSEYRGGAILTSGHDITLTDNIITGNVAVNHGGAIYVGANSSGTTTINGGSINANSVSSVESGNGYGGAIFTASDLVIDGTGFNNNSAGIGGGAIYIQGSAGSNNHAELNITDATFTNNTVTGGYNQAGSYQSGYGGAIRGAYVDIDIKDTPLSNNTADAYGGVMFVAGANIDLDGCTVEGNKSNRGPAGAIYAQKQGSDLADITVNDSTFSNNTARTNGGAIYLASGTSWTVHNTLTTTNSEFTNNKANSNGGAIYVVNYNEFSATDTLIAENSAGKIGGGIYVNQATTVVSENNGIYNNTADTDAADIYVNTYSTVTVNHATNYNVEYQNSGRKIDNWYNDNASSSSGRYDPDKNPDTATTPQETYLTSPLKLVAAYNNTVASYDVYIDGTKTFSVTEGDKFRLPVKSEDYYSEYGYIDLDYGNNDVIHKPGTEFLNMTQDRHFQTISEIKAESRRGASVYMKKTQPGIKFIADTSFNDGDPVLNKSFVYGMLITTYDNYIENLDGNLDKDGDLTDVYDIQFNKASDFVKEQTGTTITGGILNVKEENLTRPYIARAYVQIKYSDGSTKTIMSENPSNAKSISGVSKQMKASPAYSNINASEKEAIDYFASLE